MHDLLQTIFGWVCGQNPGHTWAPGGVMLPCCQRCTGLYVGACCAGWLHLWARPKLSSRFLQTHGLMLILMVPLGFHWVAQGPVLRGVSGVLFGAAVLTFLWLPLASARDRRTASQGAASQRKTNPAGWVAYGAGLTLAVVGMPLMAERGGRWASWVLVGMALGGLLMLAALVAANVCLTSAWLRRVWVSKWNGLAFL